MKQFSANRDGLLGSQLNFRLSGFEPDMVGFLLIKYFSSMFHGGTSSVAGSLWY